MDLGVEVQVGAWFGSRKRTVPGPHQGRTQNQMGNVTFGTQADQ
jgi:hypothetical protein